MRRRPLAGRRGVALVLFAALLLAGCGERLIPLPPPEGTPSTGEPTATPETARYGGILTVRLSEDPGVINPLNDGREARKVAQLLFSGLMRLDAQLLPVPDLIESWRTSPDELTWTFKLRPGVRWHDGTTLTADDVVFTYRMLLDTPVADGPVIGVAQADLQQVVDGVESSDPYTVQITLRRRFAPLLVDLTVPILPYHLLKETPRTRLGTEPMTVGTGPFRLIEQRGSDGVILEAFPQYYLGRPYVDRVAFLVAPVEDEAAKAFEEGGLLLGEIGADAAARLRGNAALQALSYPDLTYYYVGFNLRPGRPFAAKAVRQAWTYALDKEALVRDNLGEEAEPVWSDLPPYSWAYGAGIGPTQRDLGKARDLLDAAGWQQIDKDGIRMKDGQRLSAELAVRQDAPERVKLARALAAQVREAGIEVRVTPSDFGSAMAAARRPPFNFDALLMGWTIGDDPDDYYLFHSSQIPSAERLSGYNYVGFRNDEYDRLSVEARSTTDWRRRAELYAQIQRILADEQPYYFLWAERVHVLASRRLLGMPEPPSPSFWWSLSRLQLAGD